MNDGIGELITGIVIGGLFIGMAVGFIVRDTIRASAIKANVAEYVITTKETGATEFRWKEIK